MNLDGKRADESWESAINSSSTQRSGRHPSQAGNDEPPLSVTAMTQCWGPRFNPEKCGLELGRVVRVGLLLYTEMSLKESQ